MIRKKITIPSIIIGKKHIDENFRRNLKQIFILDLTDLQFLK